MKINWTVRAKNPLFWVQIALAVIVPVLGYMGLTLQDLTSWAVLGSVALRALGNPYVLGLIAFSAFNAVNDPTTAGISDSVQALTYTEPKE